jgi:hypothetical protein
MREVLVGWKKVGEIFLGGGELNDVRDWLEPHIQPLCPAANFLKPAGHFLKIECPPWWNAACPLFDSSS